MKHAFLLNAHKDTDQLLTTTRLLKNHWSQASKIIVFFDGDDASVVPKLQETCDLVLHAPYEPDKCTGILKALNGLIEYAAKEEITVASFLHADMIPIYPETFYAFLRHFEASGRILTYSPASPKSSIMDFCNLHFSIPKVIEKKLFPVGKWEYGDKPQYDFNEFQVALSFDRAYPRWRDESYLMWMISWPLHHIEGVAWHGSFVFHNYVPESSVVHTNDPWFWNHYEEISIFRNRIYPKELR